jgi:hypothetical protein
VIDSDLFKAVVKKTLSESLYRQIEPQVDVLLAEYELAEQSESEVEWTYRMSLSRCLQSLRADFKNQTKANWLAFALQRLPEADQYFDLEEVYLADIDIVPF